eukprot:2050739-Rhodomonas_salina.2
MSGQHVFAGGERLDHGLPRFARPLRRFQGVHRHPTAPAPFLGNHTDPYTLHPTLYTLPKP